MDIDEDKGGLVEEGEFKSYCKRKGSLTQILIPRKSLFQALKRVFSWQKSTEQWSSSKKLEEPSFLVWNKIH